MAVTLSLTSMIGVVTSGFDDKYMLSAGVLLDKTDSWSVIFGAVAVVYALGFAGFALLGSGELQYYDD